MKSFKELQKEQQRLNAELVECPRCGVICRWEELIEGTSCGVCWSEPDSQPHRKELEKK